MPQPTSRRVVLIGFLDQGNLGLGYLGAVLGEGGFQVELLDVRHEPETIVERLRTDPPLLVGLSIIFQGFLDDFASLARRLRRAGVTAHLCAGGHFPSLRHERTLEAIPELDSVVRFEGEATLLELARRLAEGRPWQDLEGLALRREDGPSSNPLRPLVADLDSLPEPYRPGPLPRVLGHAMAPLLASRGCPRNCCFCCIRRFYAEPPGAAVRRRRPERVVDEMKRLHGERGVDVFLFQDDDFPVLGPAGRRWVADFCDGLETAGLAGRTLWKVSCRADEVDRELFAGLRDAGLYLVYLGLESGTDAGLASLRKQLTVDDCLGAVGTLKELGLPFEFGFMLFDPDSTFERLRGNVEFLERVGGDGSVAVTFTRMLPYGGTPIEEELAREGRLRGDDVRPDYVFRDPRVGACCERVAALSGGWLHSLQALSPQINWAWHEVAILRRLFPPLAGLEDYAESLRRLTKESNRRLLEAVTEAIDATEAERPAPRRARLTADRDRLAARLRRERDRFVLAHQDEMLAALPADAA